MTDHPSDGEIIAQETAYDPDTGRWHTRLWRSIQEPRKVTISWWWAYLMLACFIGIAVFRPPGTISAVVGDGLILVAAVMISLGGAIAVFVALQGLWGIERICLAAIMTGIAIYLAAQFEAQHSTEGDRWFVIGMTSWALASAFARFMKITGKNFDPDKDFTKPTPTV